MDEKDVMRRALAAHFRGGSVEQPDQGMSGIEHVGSLAYAVLRNVNGLLAVYRVRNDGMLKRMKRWPSKLDDL